MTRTMTGDEKLAAYVRAVRRGETPPAETSPSERQPSADEKLLAVARGARETWEAAAKAAREASAAAASGVVQQQQTEAAESGLTEAEMASWDLLDDDTRAAAVAGDPAAGQQWADATRWVEAKWAAGEDLSEAEEEGDEGE